MHQNRLIVHAPGVSKSLLMDLCGALNFTDSGIRVADETIDSHLRADPATVALIGAAGTTVAAMIQAFVAIYLARKKDPAPAPQPAVQITVHLTLGGLATGTVTHAEQIEQALPGLPREFSEIRRIEIR